MEKPPLLMPGEIEYEWSQDLSKAAARHFFFRRFRNSLLLFYIGFAVSVIFLDGFRVGLIQHEPLAWIYLIPIILSLGSALILAFTYLKIARAFSQLSDRRFTIRVEPENLTFQTNKSSAAVKWSEMKRIWKSPICWIIFHQTPKPAYSALPVTLLGQEVLKTIEDKVRQHGGQVA